MHDDSTNGAEKIPTQIHSHAQKASAAVARGAEVTAVDAEPSMAEAAAHRCAMCRGLIENDRGRRVDARSSCRAFPTG